MSSIFSNFFRFFSEFFSDLIDRLFALAAFTRQLDYLITSAYVVSSVFRNFFRLFSDFFSDRPEVVPLAVPKSDRSHVVL